MGQAFDGGQPDAQAGEGARPQGDGQTVQVGEFYAGFTQHGSNHGQQALGMVFAGIEKDFGYYLLLINDGRPGHPGGTINPQDQQLIPTPPYEM
jgi:hypothetical protein